MAQKLIIDADPGIGDALAIMCAIIDPCVEVLGVTAAGGAFSGVQATRNVQALIELLDPPLRPRIGGCSDGRSSEAMPVDQQVVTPRDMNGSLGLGDYTPPEIDLHKRRESPKMIVDLVRDSPNEITLLTLGPLTNVARAFELSPDLPGLLGGLVCLGGSVNHGGNVTAAAEFNVWCDQTAARAVLRSPAAKTLVPLDISTRAVLTPEQVSQIKPVPSEASTTMEAMLQFSLRAHRQHLGIEGVRLDAIAALAVATQPDSFESRSMAIDVETSGSLTRGMTVFDKRVLSTWQTNIDVVSGIDHLGVADYFQQTIRRI